MNLKPLFDKIIAKEIIEENKNASGIIIPTLKEEKPLKARVVALSDGGEVDGKKIELKVKIGDEIIFNKFSSFEFEFEGETYLILKQEDIIGIIKK